MLKWGWWFQTMSFVQEKDMFRLTKNLQKILNLTNKWLFKEETLSPWLRVGHLGHLQCLTIQVTKHKSLKWLEEIKHWNFARQRPVLWCNRWSKGPSNTPAYFILLQNVIARKQRHNPLSSCCSSLINVLKHLDASFSESKPLNQLWNHHSPLIRLRLQFSFFKGTLLLNFNNMVNIGCWSWEFSNLKASSALCVQICTHSLIYWVWDKHHILQNYISKDDISWRMTVHAYSVTIKCTKSKGVTNSASCHNHFWECNCLENHRILVL
jgi:hypothetical protein